LSENNGDRIVVNTKKYQIEYDEPSKGNIVPTIIDIGCGYGGLMFELAKSYPNELLLGHEIRDKVANFVAQKVNTLRINSQYEDYNNVAVVRTNTMKSLHNYFAKHSVSKPTL